MRGRERDVSSFTFCLPILPSALACVKMFLCVNDYINDIMVTTIALANIKCIIKMAWLGETNFFCPYMKETKPHVM